MDRKAAVAGTFYPSDEKTLNEAINSYLDNAKKIHLKGVKGIIVPHAGYIYSGPIAGYGYKLLTQLPDKLYNIFILAPSHFIPIGASVGNFENYETPLGLIKVNNKICTELMKNTDIDFIPDAHVQEHSLEVQLPFLLKTIKRFKIVPILLGNIDPEYISKALDTYFTGPNNIFVVSSDLSHYMPYEEANFKDKKSIQAITGLDIDKEENIDACGNLGIKIIMRLAKKHGYKISLLDYRNSGDTAGDKSGVVGYGALAIFKP